jgi:DNA-directed RNA polymerase subunit RPC12/RpoP/outer membrane protein assembly factor BamB
MATTFSCPNCTAGLEYDGGDHLTVKCPYCGSTVIVPESLRQDAREQTFTPLLAQNRQLQKIIQLINENRLRDAAELYHETYQVPPQEAVEAVKQLAAGRTVTTATIDLTAMRQEIPQRRRGGCLLPTLLVILLISVIAFLVPELGGPDILGMLFAGETAGEQSVEIDGERVEDVSEAAATILSEVLSEGSTEEGETVSPRFVVGERGINPGQFNDARALAVAGDGTIYVADRDSGRLQLFDAVGAHQETRELDPELFTDDLEVDGDGVVWVQMSGRIFRFDAAGAALGQLQYSGDAAVSFKKIALALNGDLLAINGPRDTIVRFSATGETLQTFGIDEIPGAVSIDNLATDGLGNIYVIGVAEDLLGDRQDVIFKFTPEGQFAAQFGSSGNEPGSFLGILGAIVVDGAGRVYVSDFQGVQVFTNNGRFLHLITLDGFVHDLALTAEGTLLAITNAHKLYAFDTALLGE